MEIDHPCPSERDINVFERIDYGDEAGVRRITGRIGELFPAHGPELREASRLAAEVSRIIGRLDAFIEAHTASVCPGCKDVCCINKHSYYTHEDIVYLHALHENVPFHDPAVGDSEPCQFLGPRGCRIRREVRPHRCNAYFCSPLLEQMENGGARAYRRFIETLKELTDTRMEILLIFAKAAGKSAHPAKRS